MINKNIENLHAPHEFEIYINQLIDDFEIGKLSRIEFEGILRQMISRKIYVFSQNINKQRLHFIEKYCDNCTNRIGCKFIGVGIHEKTFYPNEWITKYDLINCNNFIKI